MILLGAALVHVVRFACLHYRLDLMRVVLSCLLPSALLSCVMGVVIDCAQHARAVPGCLRKHSAFKVV